MNLPDHSEQEWRIWTLPNAISFLRLLGIPLFLWLLLSQRNDTAAFFVLVIAGATDWGDGFLARRLNQQSRLGELLDPLADRLYIAATIIGLAIRDVIPWWLVVLIALRDAFLLATIPMLKRLQIKALPVTYIGKSGTFALLWGFPLFLLGTSGGLWGTVVTAFAWAFSLWGTYLYWWAGIRYFATARTLLRVDEQGR
jgi:cardiolipin synthase